MRFAIFLSILASVAIATPTPPFDHNGPLGKIQARGFTGGACGDCCVNRVIMSNCCSTSFSCDPCAGFGGPKSSCKGS
ncbi:hypothetical protein Ptr902_04190 [Pyrenophora tritici-repentis]|uniref:Uncharacterized protein n=1 Tax=Pyrenophora tritici-repentis TaxID=45151 RepID=A0A5M9L9Z5_9PLEO|nr:hypothetical protein PtrV1_07260 [Pyrenophora tritici-repentis]KAF7448317.1 hypothetical protein A1F99_076810 [Pyrenophora tritici-repentis]KAF7572034.1 hypothetical protein PtrM4_095340 [Pyrenophora tritici-repentis]KAI0576244.1 hypothetical protein Alg215_07580 [Pyrenophora tritici-repentis]KAI0577007.1 hypothetical protein Alg130_08560 [Pyrenophora tritici-repentis]